MQIKFMDAPIVLQAKLFATAAHGAIGQVRKYTGEPYILHPASVVSIVSGVRHTPAMLAAAWLHDVVEDTQIPLELISTTFGQEVSTLVDALTDVSKPEDGNRATRKALDLAHLATAPAEAQTIKLADLIDNTASIVERDPAFASIYLREKAALLEVLGKGDATLLARAAEQIRR